MACYKPLKGYLKRGGGWTFDKRASSFAVKKEISCGNCIGCRIMHAQGWALCCIHEAQLYEDNCFITLTYDNDNLPPLGNLRKSDHQKFIKRLRKKYSNKTIRFFSCGEYGDENLRPHYHTLLFNHDFADKKYYTTRRKNPVWRSQELLELWGLGRIEMGTLTQQSAGYSARYALKKVNIEIRAGADRQRRQKQVETGNFDHQTGEIPELIQPYITMSKKPGIGSGWYDKFKDDVFPDGFVVMNGTRHKVPAYYLKKYEVENPEGYQNLCDSRRDFVNKHKKDSTPDRLAVRERVKLAQLSNLKREL